MPLVRWTPALGIDGGLLDEQHRQLLAACDRLHAACAAGDAGTARRALAALRDLAAAHAAEEERRLAAAASPRLAQQRRQHGRFLAELDLLAARADGDGLAVLHAACPSLARWLVDHILVDDRACAGALRAPALAAGATA